jgi:hypothetical protein
MRPAEVVLYSQPASSHAYGRSPLCVRLCAVRLLDEVAL